MKKSIAWKFCVILSVAIIAIFIALFITNTICRHDWNEADCVTPKTCDLCKKTEGEALGHDVREWVTTVEPTCSSVGKQVGLCIRCGENKEKEISKTSHSEGEWVVTKDYLIESSGTVTPGKESLLCSECGAEIESRSYTIELTQSQENAVIKAYDLISWMHTSHDGLIYWLVDFEYFSSEDAEFAVSHMDVDWDEQAILFAKENVSGSSREGLAQMMRYEKFSNEQIEAALSEVGY